MKILLPDGYATSKDLILDMLRSARTIAVVGLSSKPFRPSGGVAEYLLSVGYKIIPVNPNEKEIFGLRSYASLDEVPDAIDIVDVFRKAPDVPPVADAAIEKGARVLWLQQGIVNEEAGEKARRAGLLVVMDACMFVEHRKRKGQLGLSGG